MFHFQHKEVVDQSKLKKIYRRSFGILTLQKKLNFISDKIEGFMLNRNNQNFGLPLNSIRISFNYKASHKYSIFDAGFRQA